MEPIPKGKTTPELRAEAVRLVETTGMPVAHVGKLAEVGRGQRLLSELELELVRTRKELAEVKLEQDLLKKCAAYFAKASR